ncbi:type II secretion system protein GspF [Spirochaetia bacterium]|nr:type II secretion system protein GspF [Spirochaetia bacterium]
MSRNTHTIQFTAMLLALIRGNTRLIDALHILSNKGIDPAVREVTGKLLGVMKKGRGFSDSLEAVNGGGVYFTPLYCTLIKAAERTGSIDAVLEGILSDLKRKQEARENLMGVMVYPLIVISMACIGTVVILLKGIPLFVDAGFLSGAVLDSAVSGIVWAGVFLVGSGGILFIVYFQIFGRDSAEFTVFYLLSFLLQNKISIHDALAQCVVSVGETKYGKALVSIKQAIASGVRLPDAFAKQPVFPAYVTGWLAIADKNGNTGEACGTIYRYFQERDARKRAIAAKCIEPAIIIITGMYVLLLIQAVILPVLTHTGGLI